MARRFQEQETNLQIESITDDTNIYPSLLFDSTVQNTNGVHFRQLGILKKWIGYSLAFGILIAAGVLLVPEFLPSRNPQSPVNASENISSEEVDEVPSGPLPRNSFIEQSSTVQHQLMIIPDNIKKTQIVPLNSSIQNIPIIEPNIPTAIHLDKTKPYVPVHITSLPTISEGSNLFDIDFPTVYHPEQEALVTKPIIKDPYNVTNYGTYKVTIYSEDSQHIIAETLLNVVPETEIRIPKQFIVRDSINNLIEGGIVTLNHSEEHEIAFKGITDKNGTVNLPEILADGAYKVEIFSPNNSKLQHLNFTMVAFENYRQETARRFIGRIDLKPNEIEIVLRWTGDPNDLDSHLYSSDGKHIYFGNKNETNMSLDYDITTGYGPETVRFSIKSNLKYVYAVHLYAGNAPLTQSKAELMFSINPQKTYINRFGTEDKLINGEKHRIPEIERVKAIFWVVFMIDGSTKQIKFFQNMFEDDADYKTNAIGTKYFTV